MFFFFFVLFKDRTPYVCSANLLNSRQGYIGRNLTESQRLAHIGNAFYFLFGCLAFKIYLVSDPPFAESFPLLLIGSGHGKALSGALSRPM